MTQRMDWRSFENSLKTEARFFSRTAADRLTSIFDDIGELQTRVAVHWWWMRVPERMFIPSIALGSFNLTTNSKPPSAGRTSTSARRQDTQGSGRDQTFLPRSPTMARYLQLRLSSAWRASAARVTRSWISLPIVGCLALS
jgi:hypothetical protein